MKKNLGSFGDVVGTTTMGERGQIVIPKEARDNLKIKTGDKFLVVTHYGKMILVREDDMRLMVKNITKHLK